MSDRDAFFAGAFLGVLFTCVGWAGTAEMRLQSYPEWAKCILAEGKWHDKKCYFTSPTPQPEGKE